MTLRKENHACSIHSPNNVRKFLCQQINSVSPTRHATAGCCEPATSFGPADLAASRTRQFLAELYSDDRPNLQLVYISEAPFVIVICSRIQSCDSKHFDNQMKNHECRYASES